MAVVGIRIGVLVEEMRIDEEEQAMSVCWLLEMPLDAVLSLPFFFVFENREYVLFAYPLLIHFDGGCGS